MHLIATVLLVSSLNLFTSAPVAEDTVIVELDRKVAVEAVANQKGFLLVDFYADW